MVGLLAMESVLIKDRVAMVSGVCSTGILLYDLPIMGVTRQEICIVLYRRGRKVEV